MHGLCVTQLAWEKPQTRPFLKTYAKFTRKILKATFEAISGARSILKYWEVKDATRIINWAPTFRAEKRNMVYFLLTALLLSQAHAGENKPKPKAVSNQQHQHAASRNMMRSTAVRPCDYSCCPCAKKSFNFRRVNESQECIPCYDWVDSWVSPEYKDYCSTTSCSESPYAAFPNDYSVMSREYYEPVDNPVDYYYADGSVVRHLPGYGNVTYPPNWGTDEYGNGWDHEQCSHYYPYYSTSTLLSRHHRRSNSKNQESVAQAAKAAAALERKHIRETNGATVPTVFKKKRSKMNRPCNLDCCSCASDMFEWTSPEIVDGSCMSCNNWVDTYVFPQYRDHCKCTADLKLEPYYTVVPHEYIKSEWDYPSDTVYYANSSVYRHVPDFGTTRYPLDSWPTPYSTVSGVDAVVAPKKSEYYSNYKGGHYYYPDYASTYYTPRTKTWTPDTAQWFYADGY
eukprot:jgi/Bigna1/82273/fgenesh1_pg.90_\